MNTQFVQFSSAI